MKRPKPELPWMGALRKPRLNNTRAVKAVLAGDLLWDKRAVARSAQKKARAATDARLDHRNTGRLASNNRRWLLTHLPGWHWEYPYLIAPDMVDDTVLRHLVSASHLPYVRRASLLIQGLTVKQLDSVIDQMPLTLHVAIVERDHHLQRVRRPKRQET